MDSNLGFLGRRPGRAGRNRCASCSGTVSHEDGKQRDAGLMPDRDWCALILCREKVPALIAVLTRWPHKARRAEGNGPTTGSSGNVIGSHPPVTFVDWQGSH